MPMQHALGPRVVRGVGCVATMLDIASDLVGHVVHWSRYLVAAASKLGVEVIDRCNLTVLLEPGQEDLPAFLAQNKVHDWTVVAPPLSPQRWLMQPWPHFMKALCTTVECLSLA